MSVAKHKHLTITEFSSQVDEAEATDIEFVVPEDLSGLSDADLSDLLNTGVELFTSIYGAGEDLSADDLSTLNGLTEGVERLQAENTLRAAAAEERAGQAQTLASRVLPTETLAVEDDEEIEVEEEEDEEEDEMSSSGETLTASTGEIRVAVRPSNRRQVAPQVQAPKSSVTDVLFSADKDVVGGIDWMELAKTMDRRLGGFNLTKFQTAQGNSTHIREQSALAVIKKPFEAGQIIRNNDAQEIDRAVQFAIDQNRLKGGSLVAAGGWCAPSTTVYDLLELESTDGLLSLPEVNIVRGGLSWTTGPDFSEIYTDPNVDFDFSEDDAIAGKYALTDGVPVVGDKPVFRVTCPDFVEKRLGVNGINVAVGLLQARGFPELIARVMRGVTVAHQHKMTSRYIREISADSTSVPMPTDQVGATAPLLDAIELQATHIRTTHRMPVGANLEAVFPNWVFGVVRADLSRRLGVDLLDVPESRVRSWFANRHINAQFIYNWQDIAATAAAAFVAWPNEISFLMYPAGTWVLGTSDVITLDTLYDSVALGQNEFTALFTEEGWMIMKRGIDSRLVTVNYDLLGAVGAGVDIALNGTAAPTV